MKLTIFQEGLPLPVVGYGGTERISTSNFLAQCELNIYDVTLVCRTESTISHPNGKVLKFDEDILQDLRKGKRKVKDYIPDGDIILVQFPESTDPMNLEETNYVRVSVCNGDVGEATGSKHQVFLTHGQKAVHKIHRSQDYSENEYVINNGIYYEYFDLVKERKNIVWLSSLEHRKSPELVPYIAEKLGVNIKLAGSHGYFNHSMINWQGEIKTEEEKNKFFSDAEVYIHTARTPIFNDPHPTTILEAQLCGIPVVGLHSGGVSEIVYDTDYIFDTVDDMIGCLKSKDYMKHKPEAIREWTIEKFSHVAMAERYNRLFDTLRRKV